MSLRDFSVTGLGPAGSRVCVLHPAARPRGGQPHPLPRGASALSWKRNDKSLKTPVASFLQEAPPLFSTLAWAPRGVHEMTQAAWGTGKLGLGSSGSQPAPTPAVGTGTLEALELDCDDSTAASGTARVAAACGLERSDGLT